MKCPFKSKKIIYSSTISSTINSTISCIEEKEELGECDKESCMAYRKYKRTEICQLTDSCATFSFYKNIQESLTKCKI